MIHPIQVTLTQVTGIKYIVELLEELLKG